MKLSYFFDYLEDKLPGKARNAFERQLQKDPFDAEAAEGLSRLSRGEAENDLNQIRERFKKRINRKRRISWYAAAASLAVLMIFATIFFNLDEKEIENRDALPILEEQEQAGEQETDEQKRILQYQESEEDAGVNNDSKEYPEHKSTRSLIDQNEDGETGKGKAAEASENIIKPSDAQEKMVAPKTEKIQMEEEVIMEDIEAMTVEDLSPTENIESPAEGEVEEVVINEPKTGKGVAMPTVVQQADKPEVELEVMQAAGAVSEPAPQPTSMTRSFPRKAMAKDTDSNAYKTIIINSNDEAEVESDLQMVSYSPALPETGIYDYKIYVDTSAIYPDIKETFGDQVVELTFIIDQEGSPVDFNIIQSPGEAFSKEAIRVITDGPKWKPATREGRYLREKIVIQVPFKQEK